MTSFALFWLYHLNCYNSEHCWQGINPTLWRPPDRKGGVWGRLLWSVSGVIVWTHWSRSRGCRDLRNFRNEAVVGRSFYVSLEVNTVIGKYFLNCMNKHSKMLVESTEPVYVEGFPTFEDVAEIDDYDFVIMIFFFLNWFFSRVNNNKKFLKNKYSSREVAFSC